ncbi:MAG TPA: hypothetical protein VKB39_08555 [Candidatus Baltobacteraceae bacterium]|nr:hypothetical protein [Candidatus Baltobacteraceae bacterium]
MERLREAKRTDHLARRLAAWLARCGDVLDSTLQEDVSPYLHEWDNIGTALAWSLNAASQDDRVLGARILVGLADLWDNASRHDEHLRWVALALEGLDESRHPIIVAKLLRWLLMRTQFQAGALDLAPRAIRLAERAGDLPELARLHSHLMRIYAVHDRLEEAERSAAIAAKLHREVGLEASPISVLFLLDRVDLRVRQGRFDDARADANEAEAKALAIAGCAGNVPKCNYRRAQIEYAAGNATEALIHIEALQGSEFLSQTDSRFVMLRWLTVLHLLLGHLNEALPPLCEMLLIVRDSESIDHTELEFAALACALGGNAIASARILGFVRAWEERAQPVRARARKDAYELLCNSLRQQLDEHELERSARAGAFLTHAHVVDEALAALELQHST